MQLTTYSVSTSVAEVRAIAQNESHQSSWVEIDAMRKSAGETFCSGMTNDE